MKKGRHAASPLLTLNTNTMKNNQFFGRPSRETEAKLNKKVAIENFMHLISTNTINSLLPLSNYSMMPGFGIMCITNRWLSLFPLTSG